MVSTLQGDMVTDLAAQALELAQWIRNVTAGKASDQITHVMVSELSEVEATLRDAADELGTRRTPKRKQAKKKRAKVRRRQPLTSRSKLNRKSDKLRRTFVRQYPCCNPHCLTPHSPVDWSHMGHTSDSGMAMKPPDDQTAPVCFACHIGGYHTRGELPGLTPAETKDVHWRWIEEHREAWEEYRRQHSSEGGALNGNQKRTRPF